MHMKKSSKDTQPVTLTPAQQKRKDKLTGDSEAVYGSDQMQRRFCNGMMRWGSLHGGQSKAAIFAGYSEATAASTAYALMQKPEIREAIAEGLERGRERCNITPERVLNAISNIAFADISDVMTWEKNKIILRDLADMEPHETAAIHTVSESFTKSGRKLEVKQHDRLRALEMLGRTYAMFKDKVDDPTKLIGGVLRVTPRKTIDEWEQEQGVSEVDAATVDALTENNLEEGP